MQIHQLFLWIVLACVHLAEGAQTNYFQLKSFAEPIPDTAFPVAAPVLSPDGWLYGTTPYGGVDGAGSIYRLRPDGTGYEFLHCFNEISGGQVPFLGLIEGPNGNFYGATAAGGTNGNGTVFQVNTNGQYVKLFDVPRTQGGLEVKAIINGNDGFLYAAIGADYAASGSILKFSTTSPPEVIYAFEGQNDPTSLMEGSDGIFYGSVDASMGTGPARFFKLYPNGTGYLEFGPAYNFLSNIHETTDGNLMAVAGISNEVLIIKCDKAGTNTQMIHTFTPGTPYMEAAIITGSDGNIYGTQTRSPENGTSTVFRISGETYSDLYTFDKDQPGSIAEGRDGWLYGVTIGNGTNFGTIFKLSKDGTQYKLLHKFGYTSDGAMPMDGLLRGSDGVLYGTTARGGVSHIGTVFKINTNGTGYKVLHHFHGAEDGSVPLAGLIEGEDGSLYGTTFIGGAHQAGSIYSIKKDGSNFRILYSFPSGKFGSDSPHSALLQGSDEKLYGTTYQYGSIYSVLTNGGNFQKLWQFSGGESLLSRLTEAPDGKLFGTIFYGWSEFPEGALFSIEKDGTGLTNIVDFNEENGMFPEGGLAIGKDGRLYGTANNLFSVSAEGTDFREHITLSGQPMGLLEGSGGEFYGNLASGFGAVFQASKESATNSLLLSFDNQWNGRNPRGRLVNDPEGSIYGVTTFGGEHTYWFPFHATREGYGSIFRLSENPAPLRMDIIILEQAEVTLRISGPPYQPFAIEIAETLVNPAWNRLAGLLNLNGAGNNQFTVSSLQTNSLFYRAISSP